jgi:hypothetical protein
MRQLVLSLSLLGALLAGRPALAEIGTLDAVPAATLLLPYFEVDLNSVNGVTTLLSINNASASSAVAHVTLWTDQAIPTLTFDVYLTGYDVQTINLRDVFNGTLPRTADDAEDPTDTISPQGPVSQDINFPPSPPPADPQVPLGPCVAPYVNPVLTGAALSGLRARHTGVASPVDGLCGGFAFGDNVARGYVTVDTVTQCTVAYPSDAGYFSGFIADIRNILWGDYFYVNPGQNFAQGDTLVHVESCVPGSNIYAGYVGNQTAGAGRCPFLPGDYTFYGRYAAVAGQDQREPLATTFASRFLNGGAFSGGTDLIVWRDTKRVPTGGNGPHSCAANPSWFPLGQKDVVAFDEQENPTDLCPSTTCFPMATERVRTDAANLFGINLGIPVPFGWLYLNLNYPIASDPFPGVAQAWVTTVMEAAGRFSLGFKSTPLDTALDAVPGGQLLLP